MGKTYNARKRKVKKNVPHGEVHIHTTFSKHFIMQGKISARGVQVVMPKHLGCHRERGT